MQLYREWDNSVSNTEMFKSNFQIDLYLPHYQCNQLQKKQVSLSVLRFFLRCRIGFKPCAVLKMGHKKHV